MVKETIDAAFKPKGNFGPATKSGGFGASLKKASKSFGRGLYKTTKVAGKGLYKGSKIAGKGLAKGAKHAKQGAKDVGRGLEHAGTNIYNQQNARYQRGEFEQYKPKSIYNRGHAIAAEHRRRVLEKSRHKTAIIEQKLARSQLKEQLRLSKPSNEKRYGPLSDRNFKQNYKKFKGL